MEQDFDIAFARVSELVADFEQHEADYLSKSYSEQDVRKDFIDKFWIALGWDVNHDEQKNPNEQEVKVERNVGVEGRVKKADYAFLTPNFRDVRFFVEAKKPARNIDNADDYFQTIRYGWNAQAAVSILMDFEQFRVLDCRLKPDVKTALNRSIPKYNFHYTDYADKDKFAEIYYLFSREAAHAGKLEEFAAAMPKPTGRATNRRLYAEAFKPVDEDFLQELDETREELARSFKLRNAHLNGEELTEATQRTIDRLVFMRFLEDKLIEPEPLVEKLGDGGSAWKDFVAQSERLNRTYNGIIFKPHFIDASDFVVDEKVFTEVRERLAHTNTVYNFNYIPIHVLGSIYERFLGKVITTTDKRARVEEKPEVRKAGGVYYTPEYIVRYIVAETIGKLIEGKKPAEIAGMRFADIACGSGSFLLGVFDELLRYHTSYYNRNKTNRAEGVRAGCVENTDGSLRLSLKQKKAILTANIYGVDLDAQAVEVAQLSLFLRLLEDETTASAKGHQLEFRETMLPDLRANIKHGNSLIGRDIGFGLFGDEEERKLSPMDFKDAFPEVMRRGGFDAIIGNPPYVLVQTLDQPYVFTYLSERYRAARYKIDTYQVFIERGINLLKNDGLFGYITPNSFIRNKHARELRRLILEMSNVEVLRVFNYPVFRGASVDVAVMTLRRTDAPDLQNKIQTIRSSTSEDVSNKTVQTQGAWAEHPQLHFALTGDETISALLKKVESVSVTLGSFATAYFGIQTFDRKKYVRDFEENKSYKPVVDGVHINRYLLHEGSEFVDFRPQAIKSGGKQEVYEQERVGVRQIGTVPIATILPAGIYTLNTIYNIFPVKRNDYSLKFILGVLSSKLIQLIWKQSFFDEKKTFPKIKKEALLSIPIRTINFSDKADRARHDKMVSLVEAMLHAKAQLQTARSDRDRDHYESKCAALDRQIDELVYELYELTTDEIAIVEGRNE